jgi:hypothetical protein
LVLGDTLGPRERGQLIAWLKANTTGGQRIRAGLDPEHLHHSLSEHLGPSMEPPPCVLALLPGNTPGSGTQRGRHDGFRHGEQSSENFYDLM